ncbi:MAG: alpha/beta hydrolase [Burkholderiaceae bacterium]|jgi:hypothetical protein|nr:alpha/beta hydrolase [Burkholderiaceae bacterium]
MLPTRRRLLTAAALAGPACIAPTLTGCVAMRPTTVPMPALVDLAPATSGGRVLLVFLPGAQERPADIVAQGFVRMLRERGIAADMLVADAHLGYFRQRVVLERLHDDLIAPALARDPRPLWLAGISLGGLGALLYASGADGVARTPVAGVLSIAPFLGEQPVVDEVIAAGGLAAWSPPAAIDARDFSRRLLSWLRGYADPAQAAMRPPLWLGYGDRDGFAEKNALVGRTLPPDRLIVAPGGHTWAPWRQIWGTMLDRAPLPRARA